MSQAFPLVPPRLKFYDASGNPAAGFSLYSYQAGTTTPLATYTDQTGVGTNANPIILDSNGECVVWVSASAYKFVLKDTGGSTVWTYDSSQTLYAGQVTQGMLAAGILTADVTGRALMANKFIETVHLDDGVVTPIKRAALGQQTSTASGTWTSTSTTMADVTNLSVSITTTGRPVFIGLIGDGSTSNAEIAVFRSSSACGGLLQIVRGATVINKYQFIMVSDAADTFAELILPASQFYIDAPAAGSYTYKIQGAVQTGTNSEQIQVINAKLIAFEL